MEQLNSNKNLELHNLVSRISAGTLPAATKKSSFIINDVPGDFFVKTDEQMLATVFANLLNTVIGQTRECCIRVSAKTYGKIVLISLRESHYIDNRTFFVNIRQVQMLAEKIGGAISISNRGKETNIILSFTNHLSAAA